MRSSIEKKYSIIFFTLVAFMILICWCANALLLSRYAGNKKEKSLEEIYFQLDECADLHGVESEEFSKLFEEVTGTYSCEIIILDQEMEVVASNILDGRAASEKLLGYIFSTEAPVNSRVLKKNDNYTLHHARGEDITSEFLELWGVMSTGNPIMIRSAFSGIHDNAKLSNVFLAYIGLITILISFFIVCFVSKTITQPILKMVDISDRMAKLDFEARYEGHDPNEIGLLGEHINKLSETLEKTISELKSTNAELEQELKKRTEIDEMRKEFLSNVSHELKTPIALIQGYAEGLMDCVNDDEESKNFYCEVIADEARKMNGLVKNLLDLNELEFGRVEITIERFDIVELVRNCVMAQDILLKQNDIKLSINQEEPIYVWSDSLRIEQVFNNYLSNAIHYADGDEKLISVDFEKIDDKIRVSVFNSGSNIPREALPHLFTKFYKVDKARTREYGGSGIGLSIVKASMQALNEKYGVENTENGVIFWFEADCNNL